MNPKILIIGGALFLMAALALMDYKGTPRESGPPVPIPAAAEGRAIVPNVSFTLLDSKTVRLHDLKGKTIILNFWATWCPPCVAEFPQLIKFAQEHANSVVLLAVSVDEDTDILRRFLAQPGNRKFAAAGNILIAQDMGQKIASDRFQALSYPETFIIGPDLTLRRKIVGPILDFGILRESFPLAK